MGYNKGIVYLGTILSRLVSASSVQDVRGVFLELQRLCLPPSQWVDYNDGSSLLQPTSTGESEPTVVVSKPKKSKKKRTMMIEIVDDDEPTEEIKSPEVSPELLLPKSVFPRVNLDTSQQHHLQAFFIRSYPDILNFFVQYILIDIPDVFQDITCLSIFHELTLLINPFSRLNAILDALSSLSTISSSRISSLNRQLTPLEQSLSQILNSSVSRDLIRRPTAVPQPEELSSPLPQQPEITTSSTSLLDEFTPFAFILWVLERHINVSAVTSALSYILTTYTERSTCLLEQTKLILRIHAIIDKLCNIFQCQSTRIPNSMFFHKQSVLYQFCVHMAQKCPESTFDVLLQFIFSQYDENKYALFSDCSFATSPYERNDTLYPHYLISKQDTPSTAIFSSNFRFHPIPHADLLNPVDQTAASHSPSPSHIPAYLSVLTSSNPQSLDASHLHQKRDGAPDDAFEKLQKHAQVVLLHPTPSFSLGLVLTITTHAIIQCMQHSVETARSMTRPESSDYSHHVTTSTALQQHHHASHSSSQSHNKEPVVGNIAENTTKQHQYIDLLGWFINRCAAQNNFRCIFPIIIAYIIQERMADHLISAIHTSNSCDALLRNAKHFSSEEQHTEALLSTYSLVHMPAFFHKKTQPLRPGEPLHQVNQYEFDPYGFSSMTNVTLFNSSLFFPTHLELSFDRGGLISTSVSVLLSVALFFAASDNFVPSINLLGEYDMATASALTTGSGLISTPLAQQLNIRMSEEVQQRIWRETTAYCQLILDGSAIAPSPTTSVQGFHPPYRSSSQEDIDPAESSVRYLSQHIHHDFGIYTPSAPTSGAAGASSWDWPILRIPQSFFPSLPCDLHDSDVLTSSVNPEAVTAHQEAQEMYNKLIELSGKLRNDKHSPSSLALGLLSWIAPQSSKNNAVVRDTPLLFLSWVFLNLRLLSSLLFDPWVYQYRIEVFMNQEQQLETSHAPQSIQLLSPQHNFLVSGTHTDTSNATEQAESLAASLKDPTVKGNGKKDDDDDDDDDEIVDESFDFLMSSLDTPQQPPTQNTILSQNSQVLAQPLPSDYTARYSSFLPVDFPSCLFTQDTTTSHTLDTLQPVMGSLICHAAVHSHLVNTCYFPFHDAASSPMASPLTTLCNQLAHLWQNKVISSVFSAAHLRLFSQALFVILFNLDKYILPVEHVLQQNVDKIIQSEHLGDGEDPASSQLLAASSSTPWILTFPSFSLLMNGVNLHLNSTTPDARAFGLILAQLFASIFNRYESDQTKHTVVAPDVSEWYRCPRVNQTEIFLDALYPSTTGNALGRPPKVDENATMKLYRGLLLIPCEVTMAFVPLARPPAVDWLNSNQGTPFPFLSQQDIVLAQITSQEPSSLPKWITYNDIHTKMTLFCMRVQTKPIEYGFDSPSTPSRQEAHQLMSSRDGNRRQELPSRATNNVQQSSSPLPNAPITPDISIIPSNSVSLTSPQEDYQLILHQIESTVSQSSLLLDRANKATGGELVVTSSQSPSSDLVSASTNTTAREDDTVGSITTKKYASYDTNADKIALLAPAIASGEDQSGPVALQTPTAPMFLAQCAQILTAKGEATSPSKQLALASAEQLIRHSTNLRNYSALCVELYAVFLGFASSASGQIAANVRPDSNLANALPNAHGEQLSFTLRERAIIALIVCNPEAVLPLIFADLVGNTNTSSFQQKFDILTWLSQAAHELSLGGNTTGMVLPQKTVLPIRQSAQASSNGATSTKAVLSGLVDYDLYELVSTAVFQTPTGLLDSLASAETITSINFASQDDVLYETMLLDQLSTREKEALYNEKLHLKTMQHNLLRHKNNNKTLKSNVGNSNHQPAAAPAADAVTNIFASIGFEFFIQPLMTCISTEHLSVNPRFVQSDDVSGLHDDVFYPIDKDFLLVGNDSTSASSNRHLAKQLLLGASHSSSHTPETLFNPADSLATSKPANGLLSAGSHLSSSSVLSILTSDPLLLSKALQTLSLFIASLGANCQFTSNVLVLVLPTLQITLRHHIVSIRRMSLLSLFSIIETATCDDLTAPSIQEHVMQIMELLQYVLHNSSQHTTHTERVTQNVLADISSSLSAANSIESDSFCLEMMPAILSTLYAKLDMAE